MFHKSKWMPLVSVIMPTYNQGAFIKESIQSVLDQTYPNFELIVVDNFSTDDTESVVRSFGDDRIRYLRFNNKGVIAAGRNFAVQHAMGEVLAFLDSDDVWLPEKLGVQLPHLCGEDVKAVSSSFEPIGNVRSCYHHLKHIPTAGFKDYHYYELVRFNPVMTSSLVMHKDYFVELGGFDESHSYRFIEDWELWIRVALHGSIRVLGASMLLYRISDKLDRDLREISKNTLNIITRQFEAGLITQKEYKQARGNCCVNIGKAHLTKRDYSGLRFYMKGLVSSKGALPKIRVLSGIVLFLLPKPLYVIVDQWIHRAVGPRYSN